MSKKPISFEDTPSGMSSEDLTGMVIKPYPGFKCPFCGGILPFVDKAVAQRTIFSPKGSLMASTTYDATANTICPSCQTNIVWTMRPRDQDIRMVDSEGEPLTAEIFRE